MGSKNVSFAVQVPRMLSDFPFVCLGISSQLGKDEWQCQRETERRGEGWGRLEVLRDKQRHDNSLGDLLDPTCVSVSSGESTTQVCAGLRVTQLCPSPSLLGEIMSGGFLLQAVFCYPNRQMSQKDLELLWEVTVRNQGGESHPRTSKQVVSASQGIKETPCCLNSF